jgi:hypothetical protein
VGLVGHDGSKSADIAAGRIVVSAGFIKGISYSDIKGGKGIENDPGEDPF